MFSPESSNLQDLDLADLADGLLKPPPFGVSPSLMLIKSFGNAFLCECTRFYAIRRIDQCDTTRMYAN
ncbi:hypothetical protein MRY16398_14010 [Phytobacter sp. MRY16-398]|nr:hypothetical protein MRY16398_14010 [Phytobacter sp. MRY16-398]